MRRLTAALCLTLAVLLGSAGCTTALRELTPLAEQGNADAQYYLGVMYHKGRGVPWEENKLLSTLFGRFDIREEFATIGSGNCYWGDVWVPHAAVEEGVTEMRARTKKRTKVAAAGRARKIARKAPVRRRA
jgi:hypothetical protein